MAAGTGAVVEDGAEVALALADDATGAPPIGVRSALSLVVSYEIERALKPPQTAALLPLQGRVTEDETVPSEAPLTRAEPQ